MNENTLALDQCSNEQIIDSESIQFVEQFINELVDKKNKSICKALNNKPYCIKQAIKFLSSTGYPVSIQDLNYFVVRKILTPCFLYEGTLNVMYNYDRYVHQYLTGTVDGFDDNEFDPPAIAACGQVKVIGYITPTDKFTANRLVTSQISLPVLNVTIHNTIEPTVRYSEDNYYAPHEQSTIACYQITSDCNYAPFKEGYGIDFNLTACVFLKHELEAILRLMPLEKKSIEQDINSSGTTDYQIIRELEEENHKLKQHLDAAIKELSMPERVELTNGGYKLIGILLNYLVDNPFSPNINQSSIKAQVNFDYSQVKGLGTRTIDDLFSLANKQFEKLPVPPSKI